MRNGENLLLSAAREDGSPELRYYMRFVEELNKANFVFIHDIAHSAH